MGRTVLGADAFPDRYPVLRFVVVVIFLDIFYPVDRTVLIAESYGVGISAPGRGIRRQGDLETVIDYRTLLFRLCGDRDRYIFDFAGPTAGYDQVDIPFEIVLQLPSYRVAVVLPAYIVASQIGSEITQSFHDEEMLGLFQVGKRHFDIFP